MPDKHWMTFGTFAEQRYFTYPSKNTYTGVIINANMLAHAPSGLAGFLLEKTRPEFPYLIDPLTHAFQHDVSVLTNKQGEVKSSVANLAKDYGTIISENVGKRPLTPADFDDQKMFEEFVSACLAFQEEKLGSAIRENEAFKYIEEYGEKENPPYALVAPYFYMDELTITEWLPILHRSAKYAQQIKKDSQYKVFSAVVINQGILLEPNLIDLIIETLNDTGVSGYLLWVDDLDETNSNRAVLKGLLKLSKGLRDEGKKELINLHGGYFSILASSNEFGSTFSGISHGPEFGEFRKIVPVGGGIPVAKFYIRQLHSRIRYREAIRYFRAKHWLDSSELYYENICNCDECKKVIQDDPNNFTIYGISETRQVKRGKNMVSMEYSIRETKEHCLKHYLQKKNDEFEFVNNSSKRVLLDNLQSAIEEFSDIAGKDAVSHLILWQNVLA